MATKRFSLFPIVFLLTFLATSPVSADQRLTVVADEWPPFSGERLPGQGISIDVITAVLKKAGYEVDAKILPWARIMDGSRSGEYDVVGSLFFDAEIATYMSYGDPFFQTSVKFVQKAGANRNVKSLAALKSYSIAVGDGFLYEERFDRATDLNKIVVTNTLQGIQMVAFDRADLTLDSEEVLRHALSNEAVNIRERVEIMPHGLALHDAHMAVRKSLPNSDQVVKDFNRVLSEMKADGSLDTLLDKHR